MARLPEFLRPLFHGGSDPAFRQVRIIQGILLTIIGAYIIWLIDMDKPWEGATANEVLFGPHRSLNDYISFGLFWAGITNTFFCLILYATAQWWGLRRPVAPDKAEFGETLSKPGRWFYIALLAAVVLAGALRWNLAHGSLWWDESWTLRKSILGEWKMPDPKTGEATFNPRKWKYTLYYYKKPTNHVPFAAASRLCLETWQSLTGRERYEFDEFILRLPAFVASLLSVFLIGLLVHQCGFTRAGPFAAFMLALHPWHIRYSIDARSFSFLILGTLLMCWMLIRALRTGLWRYWVGYGVSVFFTLWSFPYGLYLVAILGITGMIAIFWRHRFSRTAWISAGRFMIANTLAAMLLFQMILPHLPQITHWSDVITGSTMINHRLVLDLWAAFTTGMPHAIHESGGEHLPSVAALAPWIQILLMVVVAILCLAGLTALWRRRSPAKYVVTAWIIIGPLAVWLAYVQTHYFYTRYVIYGMVALIVVVTIGADVLGSLCGGKRFRHAPYVALILLVGSFATLTHARRSVLQNYSIAPSREVADFIRNIQDNASEREVIAVGFNLGGRPPRNYNPSMRWTIDSTDIPKLMAEATARNADLYIYCGYGSFNRADEPTAFTYFDNPDLFEVVGEFRGIEAAFYYRIFRYTGAPLAP